MTTEDAFLKAILKDSADGPARLVFADWLEERGDPRAGVVRARPEVFRFIANLATAEDTPSDQMNQFVEAGEADLLAAIASFLKVSLAFVRNRRQSWVPGQTLEQLTDALAITPGQAAVDAVVEAVSAAGEKQFVCRDFAAKLAQGQPHDLLLATMAKHLEEPALGEFRACLVQEMVLRGACLDGQPVAEQIRAKLRGERHLLAGLPLHLTGTEGELPAVLPHYGVGCSGGSCPGPSRGVAGGQSLPLVGDLPSFEEASEVRTCRRISSAFRNWQEESNGKVEARVFLASSPLAAGHLSASMLGALGLACLDGVGDGAIGVERVPASQAICVLFSAAANGGAYNHGLRGAYGRLEAWHSLAALAGVVGDDVEAVADIAERCLWVSFGAGSEWFHQVAWDAGLLAVRPDGRSVAVLAASDTD
jgi:uncharacterized protein (TIGR02996 family)